MIDTIKLIIKYLQSDYKISVKGLTNDKQCFILSKRGVILLFLRRSADNE